MQKSNQQALIVIEGRATYERILSSIGDMEQEEAIRQIQNYLKVYPEFAQAHNDLGVIYYRAGNLLLALAHYEKAHKLDPLNITYRKNLADFYAVELDWADEAIHIYLDILKDNPFDVDTLNALGTINHNAGRKEQARQFYSRALQLDSYSTTARDGLHLLSGTVPSVPSLPSPQEAAPPVPPEQLHEQALTASKAGATKEAMHILEALISLHPHYAAGFNDLGVLCQQAGELERAKTYHEDAARLAPGNATFQKNLADLLVVNFRDYEQALRIYLTLLQNNGSDVEVLNALAYICIEMEKTDDARAFLQRTLSIEPWNKDARETLRQLEKPVAAPVAAPARSAKELHEEAIRLSSEERLQEARQTLEECIRLHGASALAYNDLGVVAYQLGDVDGARKAYERAVELEPNNGVFRRNLADLYFSAVGKVDEAIGIYLDLHRQNPRDIETLLNLGHICAGVERPEEAKTFYRRALEIEPWNQEARTAMKQVA